MEEEQQLSSINKMESQQQQKIEQKEEIIQKFQAFLNEYKLKEGLEYAEQVRKSSVEFEQDETITNYYAKFLLNVNYSEAKKLMETSYQKNPFNYWNSFQFFCLIQDNDIDRLGVIRQEALKLFKKQKSKDGYYFACLGILEKNPAQCRKQLEKAQLLLKELHEVVALLIRIGNTYFIASKFDQAVTYYRQAHKFSPDDVDCLSNISSCYHLRYDYENAIIFGELALEKNPGNYSTLSNLAQSYEKQYKFEKANECYQKMLQVKGIGSIHYTNYAIFLFNQLNFSAKGSLDIISALSKALETVNFQQSNTVTTLLIMIKTIKRFNSWFNFSESVSEFQKLFEIIRQNVPSALVLIKNQLIKNEIEAKKLKINPQFFASLRAKVEIEINKNPIVLSLSRYETLIKPHLHFQGTAQFWDLYLE